MKKLSLVSLFIALVVINFPAHTHHSFAATFTTDTVSVEGVVKSLRFVNPHVLLTLSVKDDDGEVTEWISEGGAASLMRRQGWGPETLRKGDYVRVTGNSTRNGSPMVTIGIVEFINPDTGEVIGQAGQAVEQEEYAKATVKIMPMTLSDGIPNLTGTWSGPPRKRRGNTAGGGTGGRGSGGARIAGPASSRRYC